ncbi:hypothetical protein D1781_00580 [Amnibacterium setariae]|uniref:Uncharacterized protein n=1 Tax=Amnibacterium setariae TaxID=2306585 RepID=A0A3A1U9H2_9MICO|nr:hypothetical protein D1781_00580 [Amnibacterium setariae]
MGLQTSAVVGRRRARGRPRPHRLGWPQPHDPPAYARGPRAPLRTGFEPVPADRDRGGAGWGRGSAPTGPHDARGGAAHPCAGRGRAARPRRPGGAPGDRGREPDVRARPRLRPGRGRATHHADVAARHHRGRGALRGRPRAALPPAHAVRARAADASRGTCTVPR